VQFRDFTKIWVRAKEKLTTEEIKNKFLLVTDNDGRPAWHFAAAGENSELLQKLWECAKEKLTTAWHIAAAGENSELLQKLWECAKEKLTTEEIKDKLFLGTDKWKDRLPLGSRVGQYRDITKYMVVV